MTETIELIVLSTTQVRENALVVQTLSREWGRRGFLVRSAKKAQMSLFLPLNILEAEVTDTPKSELKTLRRITPGAPLLGIRNNLYKNTMTLFLSELLLRTVREGAIEDGLVDWCVGSILTLEDIAPFSAERTSLLAPIVQGSFADAMLAPLNGATRNALCEDLVRYLEFHTDQPIRIKSLSVLRELYR